MFLSDDGCKFELSRMCPTGSIQFFFTISIGLNGKKIFVSRDYQKIY